MIDTQLIKKCQEGDEDAFEALYNMLYKKAIWTAYLILGNLNYAEDTAQDTFYECFKGISTLKNPETFMAWFNKILVRKSWYLLKRNKKIVSESLEDQSDKLLSAEDGLSSLEAEYEKSIIRKSVNSLNTEMRTTVILYYYNEFSIKEIAKVMGCMQGTVKSRLHYARIKLEKELKDNLYDDNRTKHIRREAAANE